ncbi:MAG: hypothetical protein ICV69_11295 [Thermoleophilaceae bacterium]|nr:hypothetical protein [Thermoleophilaceae bacterium]
MSRQPTTRLAALALAGGLAFAIVGVIRLTHAPFEGHYASTTEYAQDIALLSALLLTIPGLVALRRIQGAPRGSLAAAVAGQALLGTGVAGGIASGEDPSWFFAVAGPALLLLLFGTVWIGIHTWRAGFLPRWGAVGIALTVPVGIAPLSEVGGSLLVGLLWIYLAARLMAPGARQRFPLPAGASENPSQPRAIATTTPTPTSTRTSPLKPQRRWLDSGRGTRRSAGMHADVCTRENPCAWMNASVLSCRRPASSRDELRASGGSTIPLRRSAAHVEIQR